MRAGQGSARIGDAVSSPGFVERLEHLLPPSAVIALHRQGKRQRFRPVWRMTGGGDPTERPFPEQERLPAGGVESVRTEGQIQFTFSQMLHDVARRGAQHVHVDRWV